MSDTQARPSDLDAAARWQWPAAYAVLLVSCVWVTVNAVPIMWDGVDNLRLVKLTVPDEERILSGVWRMVQEGSVRHGIVVYPDLFPLVLGAVRACLGDGVSTGTHVAAARAVSLVGLWLAILIPFVFLSRFTRSPLLVALFSALICIHPEMLRWSARVHPDTLLMLFNHAALVFLGLYVREQRQGHLYAASALAALSAGTKLVGFFIMLCICAWVVWLHRRQWRTALRFVVVQGAFFMLVFLAVNPQLFVDPAVQLVGWSHQNKANRHGGKEALDWVRMLVDPQGLGLGGAVVVLWGLVRLAMGKLDRGMVAIGSFGVFFLGYLLVSVTLVLPRYAFPASWPLLLVGLCALRSDLRRCSRAGIAVAVVAAGLFVVRDVPARARYIGSVKAAYSRLLTPDLQALADYLRRLGTQSPGPVYSYPSATIYAPPEVEDWRPVWSAESIPRPERGDPRMVLIIDPRLRAAGGEFYGQVVAGETQLALRKTIGVYAVYFGPERPLPEEKSGVWVPQAMPARGATE